MSKDGKSTEARTTRNRMRVHRLAIAFPLAAVLACGGSDSVTPTPPPASSNDQLHTAAINYLDRAIDLMQTRAFYRRRVNWDSVRANAHAQAAAAISFRETYTAISQALRSLGDKHSFLQPPLTSAASSDLAASVTQRRVDSIDGDFLDGKFGYVHVPTFSQTVPGGNATALADSLQALIRKFDANDPCGWIVDLRRNLGGNMWPMLAGVGPILGNDETVGHFVDADSNITTWFYSNGASGTRVPSGGRNVSAQISRTPYVLRRPNSPVAVLTDSLTASSGEAITVAFRGLSRARSFGNATAGVPTANAGFPLSDGATLYLMTALDSDRLGRWYSDRIQPDEKIFLATYPATDDAIVVAAKNWLHTQSGCAP